MVITGIGNSLRLQYIKKYYNTFTVFLLNNRKIDIIHYNLKIL